MAYILFCFILEKAKTLIIQNRWYNKVYSCAQLIKNWYIHRFTKWL